MRFLLLMLTTAFGLACEKDPALSKTTNNLSPVAQPALSTSGTEATPRTEGRGAAVAASDLNAKGSEVVAPAVNVPRLAAPTGSEPMMAKPVLVPPPRATDPAQIEEGNGEPMDDVDDEIVPVTDKSGADNTEMEEGPTGPVDDDPEAADIDVRQ